MFAAVSVLPDRVNPADGLDSVSVGTAVCVPPDPATPFHVQGRDAEAVMVTDPPAASIDEADGETDMLHFPYCFSPLVCVIVTVAVFPLNPAS